MCLRFRSISGSSVVLRSRFRRSHGICWKNRLGFDFSVLGLVFFPLHCVGDGNKRIYPPGSAVCAFSESIHFHFRVHAMRVSFVSLDISGYTCSLVVIAQLSTMATFSPFFWENLVMNAECAYWLLDLSVPNPFYLVGINLFNVIAS